jgi:hypothetical protein
MPDRFASYLDGGAGNDILNGEFVNDLSGDDYDLFGGPDKNTLVTFKGLNTLVGGQGSDTFVVKNGGNAIGDEFDWVVKYGNETPVDYGAGGVGASLNGGQHNLVVSRVDFLTLSDELVNQGRFIDQLALAGLGQFGQGNRLDNYIYDAGSGNTLVGDKGRDSIVGAGQSNLLIGGTAYGVDQVGLAVKDFASVVDGGNGTTNSIFRDTDPIPVSPNGPATADPSQFWFVPGYYGGVYDPNRNQDTLIANSSSTLDGGAGRDSLVGSGGIGDMFFVSQGSGGTTSQAIEIQDAVFGNGGNDTVTFTDSDYLWWSGHEEGALLDKHGYTLGGDIANLILQEGSPSARNGYGNALANIIQGNEFDNIIDAEGVGIDAAGVDMVIGGSGKDNFIVNGRGTALLSAVYGNNTWAPEVVGITQGALAGYSVWDQSKSAYKDGAYAVIQDFEAGDNLQLEGATGSYWIGVDPIVEPPAYPATLNAGHFGIYQINGNGGKPNLVAVVNLVGGLSLDTQSLELAFEPVAPDSAGRFKALTGSTAAGYLGWGTFWKLEGSSFAKYVNQSYVQEDSFASLPVLVHSGDETFQGGNGADTFNGYGGNDSILGGDGNDTFLAGSGNDSLFGQDGNDSLLGGTGADYIDGGAGTDQMIGGTGDDTFVVDTLTDAVTEQANEGTDLVLASVSGYALTDNVENLTLTGTAINGTGNALDNRLTGNSLNNTLAGLAGADNLRGDAGNDTIYGADDDNLLDGGGQTDWLIIGSDFNDANDAQIASIENVLALTDGLTIDFSSQTEKFAVTGFATGSTTFVGGNGADTFTGGSGTDSINGGDGADWLSGTSAAAVGANEIDTLTGGTGADTFILGDLSNDYYSAAGAADYALIEDFNTAVDKLQIRGASGNYLVGGIDGDGYQSITFVATSELIAKVKTQAADAITLNTMSVAAV